MIESIKQAMAAVATIAVVETDYTARGYHLDIQVAPDQLVAAVEVLDKKGLVIESVTGVDWLGEHAVPVKKKAAPKKDAEEGAAVAEPEEVAPPKPDEMEVVYDFMSFEAPLVRVVIRTRVWRDTPEVPTISHIFPGANWHERETHDFFGIQFLGHPYLKPLLLPEDADFHPLRKDFTA